jgi:hypothetical protein
MSLPRPSMRSFTGMVTVPKSRYLRQHRALHVFQIKNESGQIETYLVYEYINDLSRYIIPANITPTKRDDLLQSFCKNQSANWNMMCIDQEKINKLTERVYHYLREKGKLQTPLNLSDHDRGVLSDPRDPINLARKDNIFKLDLLQQKQLEIEMLLRSIQNAKCNPHEIEQGFLERVNTDQVYLYFILQYLINEIKLQDANLQLRALGIQLCIYTLNDNVNPHAARESLINVLEKMASKDNRLRNNMVMIYPLSIPNPVVTELLTRGLFMYNAQRLVRALRTYNYAQSALTKIYHRAYFDYIEYMKSKGHWKDGLIPKPQAVVDPDIAAAEAAAEEAEDINKLTEQYARLKIGGKSKRVNRVKRSKCKRSSTKRRKH